MKQETNLVEVPADELKVGTRYWFDTSGGSSGVFVKRADKKVLFSNHIHGSPIAYHEENGLVAFPDLPMEKFYLKP